jgi:hypothetical protein
MNVLGKILVFGNLLFCIVTAGLISWAYAARTNWFAYAKKLETVIKVVEANADTYRLEAEEARKKAEEYVAAKREELKRTEAARDSFKNQADEERRQFQAEKEKGEAAAVNQQSVTREIERRRQEVDYLTNLKASQDKKMADMALQQTQLRNRAVEADISLKSSEDRNAGLLANLETLTKEIERLRAGGSGRGSTASNSKPPPDDVRGTVQAVDRSSGLVTISIGSDHGLSPGNTLDIFRTEPKAEYLGVLQILSVRPDQAVGRPVGRISSPIQVQDRVASKIGNS